MDAQRKPIAELPDDPESVQLPKNMLAASPDSFESQLLGAPIETVPEKVMEASPVTYVKHGTPPFLIMHGLNAQLFRSNRANTCMKNLLKKEMKRHLS
jgi:hypothetical protein